MFTSSIKLIAATVIGSADGVTNVALPTLPLTVIQLRVSVVAAGVTSTNANELR